jgi:hypothetical protein
MKIDYEEINIWIAQARRDDLMSTDSIEKHAFKSLLGGMIIKLLDKKSVEAQKQLGMLYRMESYLERLTYKNCIHHFQAKTITAQDRRIAILEEEKQELIQELEQIKKRIE